MQPLHHQEEGHETGGVEGLFFEDLDFTCDRINVLPRAHESGGGVKIVGGCLSPMAVEVG